MVSRTKTHGKIGADATAGVHGLLGAMIGTGLSGIELTKVDGIQKRAARSLRGAIRAVLW